MEGDENIMKKDLRLFQTLLIAGCLIGMIGCAQPEAPQVEYSEEAEIKKDGWIIKASNVPEGVKFEITKPVTVRSMSWAAIDKCSSIDSTWDEARGVINIQQLLNDAGVSTLVFPFVNPNENTKLRIKIQSDVGNLDENLYIKTTGGMGCPDYTNALPKNNVFKVTIDNDKMMAEIKKYEMPDFSKVKLHIVPTSSMIELHKYPDWSYLTGEYKNNWESNFNLEGASRSIPFGESKVILNYLRSFKIDGDTSYDKYFDSFRIAGFNTTVDISSLYLTATDMWYLRGRKYKSIEKYALANLPDGAEAYVVVKFADLASGYNGVTGGAMIDFSKVPDIASMWGSIKANYMRAEIDDEKYTAILWNTDEDTEETVQQRNCKGLSDLSKIMFTENGTTYTALPF